MINEQSVFIAFDTETTGLSATEGRIVEIAALKFNLDGEVIGEFSELVNPKVEIPQVVIKIHGITNQIVADKPSIDIILPKFIDFFSREPAILIAQNAAFDVGFVNKEAERHKINIPENIILDQIDFTRKVFPSLPTYSLENTCRRFKLIDKQLHRAMADAVLVMKLFGHCLSQFKTREEGLRVLNALSIYNFGKLLVTSIDKAVTDTINRALKIDGVLEIVYSGGSMQGRPRPIAPLSMYNRDGLVYVVAKCLLTGANKQFRIDRIEDCILKK